METFKKIILYSFLWIFLIGLVLANRFHGELESYTSFVPQYSVLALTLVFCTLLIFLFTQKERDLENLKYQFLTIVTHKFRTSLTGIKWAIDSLKGETTIEDKDSLIKSINGAIAKLMQVVDHLAGVARFDSRLAYAFKAVSFREMVDDALGKLNEYIRRKDLHFDIQADSSIPLIVVDEQKIQFVLDTLFENAMKYTPNGGLIKVSLQSKNNQIYFSIKDSGIGLNTSDKRRLFKKFWRSEGAKSADPEGLGLALFVSNMIVKHHNGKIWAESRGRNKGTTFNLVFNINR